MEEEKTCPNCGGELYPEEDGSCLDYECIGCDEKYVFSIERGTFVNIKNLH